MSQCRRLVGREDVYGRPKCIHGPMYQQRSGWRCAEKAREKTRKQYAANPEKAREKTRKWRAANSEKAREYARKLREDPVYRFRYMQYKTLWDARRQIAIAKQRGEELDAHLRLQG